MFLEGIRQIMVGSINLSSDDIRVALLMNTTTADTDADTAAATTVNAITTLAESDATGYARQSLTTEAVAIDDPNNRVEFDDTGASSASFSGMTTSATNNYQGVLLYKHVGADTSNVPIAWIEFSAEVTNTATQVDVTWNAEGIIQGRTG